MIDREARDAMSFVIILTILVVFAPLGLLFRALPEGQIEMKLKMPAPSVAPDPPASP